MSIREEARQEAERRWPSPNSGLYEGLIIGFEKGAVWAREKADRELSDAEVRDVLYFALRDAGEGRTEAEKLSRRLSAALLAAQEVRRADNS